MEVFDNLSSFVGEDLKKTIKKDSKLAIAASCFSLYAYDELKRELEGIEELRFLFTSPTFIKEKAEKQKREFFIPRIDREKSIYGSEFEIKLKNVLTQKSIAKECAEWIKRKVKFKSNKTNQNMQGFYFVDNKESEFVYSPIDGFTTIDLGNEKGNNAYFMVNKLGTPYSKNYLRTFDSIWNDKEKLEDVTDIVIENITQAYNENSPELIYFITLYNVFNEFLDDINEDVMPNEATGFKETSIWNTLYDFQKDAVLGIINKLEKYNGCILADSVGLGKTFSALAVIKYYENKNKNVLVLCPKKLQSNWNMYKGNYVNNPLLKDRLRYDVLFHTDLSRKKGISNGLDLALINWSNYDLVVIDESHNFRNGANLSDEDKENRYLKLLNNVIKEGVKTKVLMLSATPVNNKFSDLKNQIKLAFEGTDENIDKKLNTTTSIDEIFKQAQRAFGMWAKLPTEEQTTENLLKRLDFDFFEVLDSVTIARSRKQIEKSYNMKEIGEFPNRLKPKSMMPKLTDLKDVIDYKEIYESLILLNLEVYTPSLFIFDSQLHKYQTLSGGKEDKLTQRGREEGIRKLMRVNLLKRLESSITSFTLTLTRIKELMEGTIKSIDEFKESGSLKNRSDDVNTISEYDYDLDLDDEENELFSVGKTVKIQLKDMDYLRWRELINDDLVLVNRIINKVSKITSDHDEKLSELRNLVEYKINNPINAGNKKVIIFTAFSDTAKYIYDNIKSYFKERYRLESALITGNENKSTVRGLKSDMNEILTNFSPLSKDRNVLVDKKENDIDILIATDCISEGQNLQDCDYLINYDIHWNPVRIIQRFGRINRIGSKNHDIQLVNFWPNIELDEYINLKARVETKMKATNLTATGDEDILSGEDSDLEYRRKQLTRLQNEVVDLEEMTNSVSIMDLGLNDYRIDLLEYSKNHDELDKKPDGLHAVVPKSDEYNEGVIFVLKNKNNSINKDNLNRIHPFYMVYISKDGEILCDYLKPKDLLDTLRSLCKGKDTPIKEVYELFNKETQDGKNMKELSNLLSDAINSIIDAKEEKDVDSLFKPGGTSFLLNKVTGMQDFELICFLVIK